VKTWKKGSVPSATSLSSQAQANFMPRRMELSTISVHPSARIMSSLVELHEELSGPERGHDFWQRLKELSL